MITTSICQTRVAQYTFIFCLLFTTLLCVDVLCHVVLVLLCFCPWQGLPGCLGLNLGFCSSMFVLKSALTYEFLAIIKARYALQVIKCSQFKVHSPDSFCCYHKFYPSFFEALIDFARFFLLNLLLFQGK